MMLWGQSEERDSISVSYEVSHLGRNINTNGGESGGVVIKDSLFFYSSIQNVAEHQSAFINFDQILMQVFQSPILSDGRIGKGRISKLDFNTQTMHAGNVAYDENNEAFYFTRCAESSDGEYLCEIYVIKRTNGRWQKAVKLTGDVNLQGYTSTQPSVAYLPDGRTMLYFSSNRPGGMGGMDIWYSIITKDKAETAVCLGELVNSSADEITPFYQESNHTLYFSSNRAGGNGGYDVYSVKGGRNTWKQFAHLPEPINTEYNDLYFVAQSSDKGFITSNRDDSYYVNEPSCCNDIYRWYKKTTKHKVEKPIEPEIKHPEAEEVVATSETKEPEDDLFPIKLFFHNDEPDPNSQSDTTSTTYFQTYNKYMFMRGKYINVNIGNQKGAVADSLRKDVNHFFDEEVKGNCEKFELFIERLVSELYQGRNIKITVAGYASPLHNNEYNDHLAQRRATTILNQFAQYKGGVLVPYIGTSLQLKLVSYGSRTATKSKSDPVYGMDAARERRIEILGYEYF